MRCLQVVSGISALALLMVALPPAFAAEMSSEITVSAQDFDEYLPDVAYNSAHDEYFVVWHDSSPLQPRSVMGRRYTAAGAFIAEYVIAFNDSPPRDSAQASVAYDPVNDRYLVVWVYDYFGDGSDWDVHGRLVPWDGPDEGLAVFSVNDFTSKQWNPRVAWGGTVQEFMVTWWNEGSGAVASYISAQRVAAAGNKVGGAFAVTYDPGYTEERVAPDIAYNQARNEYIVVYQKMEAGGGDVYGVRLSGAGAILGGGDFGIAGWPDAETAPRIAASRVSDMWAVAWQSQVSPTDKHLFARLVWVDGTGTVQMAAPKLVEGTTSDNQKPDVAAYPESSTFLITSEEGYTSGYLGIVARTLDASNSLGTIYDVRFGVSGNSTNPAVAAGRTGWMMAWEQDRDAAATYQDIHGRIFFSEVFSDGFESNNTSQWSTTVQ